MLCWFIVLTAIIAELGMSTWWVVLLGLGYFWYLITKK